VLRLARGPKEHRFRPAIDPLFRSAAQVYGPAVIGVVLTGHLDDGTAGLQAIKALGGLAVVQTPSDAVVPSMPESALRHVSADHVVPLDRMAQVLTDVVNTPLHEMQARVPDDVRVEVEIARERSPLDAGLASIAQPSIFTCPECSGVLLELTGKRYRCHTGHAYSAQSLAASLQEAIEDALWNALRSMEEEQPLLERSEDPATATEREARVAADRRDAAALRTIIAGRVPVATVAG